MKTVTALAIGAALVGFVASPALAQRQGLGENAPEINTRVHPEGAHARGYAAPLRGRHAPSAYRAHAQANPGDQSNGGRDAAMRECTELSRKYTQTTWGDMDIQQQRACMAEHGQPE